jgi:hypothetical protein
MPLLSCHGPSTADKQAGSDFILPDSRCRLSTEERRETAVASPLDRILFLWTEGTICFGMNLIGFGNSGHENRLVASTIIFFLEELALPSALNIGAGAVSSIGQEN